MTCLFEVTGQSNGRTATSQAVGKHAADSLFILIQRRITLTLRGLGALKDLKDSGAGDV